MSQKISKRLQLRVLDTLRTANTPLTTSEVAMLVGRSFEATRRALAIVGAVRTDDSYPAKWTIDKQDIPTHLKKVPSKFTDDEYVVTTKAFDQPVVLWNEQRKTLSKAIASLEITPDAKPRELAKKLGTAAGSMAHVAYMLSEAQTHPNWYDELTQER